MEAWQAANVHLRAVEHKHSIVFLHAVNEGPANQSYGLQVAALAGVPESVIKTARKYLVKLEQESVVRQPQRDLFAGALPESTQSEHPVLKRLQAMAPDELSPRQALEQLYEMKKMMQKSSPAEE